MLVEWRYDGPDGKVIKWTNEHGNRMKDPAYQVWILRPDLTEFARWGPNRIYEPESFVRWLEEQAKEWAAAATGAGGGGVPKIKFQEESAKEGEGGEFRFEEIDKACASGDRPVLIYFQQPGTGSSLATRGRAEESKASREFEKGVLASDAIIKLAGRFECFRIDMSREADRRLAKKLGVETAPAVVLWGAGGGKEGSQAPKVLRRPAEKALLEAMRALAGQDEGG